MSPAGHTLCVLLSCPNPTLCVRNGGYRTSFGRLVRSAKPSRLRGAMERHTISSAIPRARLSRQWAAATFRVSNSTDRTVLI